MRAAASLQPPPSRTRRLAGRPSPTHWSPSDLWPSCGAFPVTEMRRCIVVAAPALATPAWMAAPSPSGTVAAGPPASRGGTLALCYRCIRHAPTCAPLCSSARRRRGARAAGARTRARPAGAVTEHGTGRRRAPKRPLAPLSTLQPSFLPRARPLARDLTPIPERRPAPAQGAGEHPGSPLPWLQACSQRPCTLTPIPPSGCPRRRCAAGGALSSPVHNLRLMAPQVTTPASDPSTAQGLRLREPRASDEGAGQERSLRGLGAWGSPGGKKV
jgi:hypothetical protein